MFRSKQKPQPEELPAVEVRSSNGMMGEGPTWAVEHVHSEWAGRNLHHALAICLEEGTAKGWTVHDIKMPGTAHAYVIWRKPA